MANETDVVDEVIRESNDDPHFETALAKFPVYTTSKLCGYSYSSSNMWFRRTKTRPAVTLDPFTRETKLKAVATIIKKEQKAGLARIQLYEFLEIRYSKKLCRIPLGTKELIMHNSDLESEYKSLDCDLSDAIKIIRNAIVSGLLPQDFLNQEMLDRLDDDTD